MIAMPHRFLVFQYINRKHRPAKPALIVFMEAERSTEGLRTSAPTTCTAPNTKELTIAMITKIPFVFLNLIKSASLMIALNVTSSKMPTKRYIQIAEINSTAQSLRSGTPPAMLENSPITTKIIGIAKVGSKYRTT